MKVLLIHGLGRSPLSVFGLSQYLQQAGYRTELFGYSSRVESYVQIIERLQDRLWEMEPARYGIVAHSLGAVLVRSAIPPHSAFNPDPIILLGPPNQSPRIAQMAQRFSPLSPLAGECFQNLADPSFFQQLPKLDVPHTIIAGTNGPRGTWSIFGNEVNDGVLTLNEMQLDDCSRSVILPVNHIQMLNHPLVQQTILQILADPDLKQDPSST